MDHRLFLSVCARLAFQIQKAVHAERIAPHPVRLQAAHVPHQSLAGLLRYQAELIFKKHGHRGQAAEADKIRQGPVAAVSAFR
jgi:hypothetical protein